MIGTAEQDKIFTDIFGFEPNIEEDIAPVQSEPSIDIDKNKVFADIFGFEADLTDPVAQQEKNNPPVNPPAEPTLIERPTIAPLSAESLGLKPQPAAQDVTATITDPLLKEKYKAVAEAESPLEAGLKQAGEALTYSESPVSAARKEVHPKAAIAGEIAGTVFPIIAGGSGLIKAAMRVPKITEIAKSGKAGKVAVNGVLRASTAAYDYLARHNKELLSDDPTVSGEAKKNLVINIAASMASPAPEAYLPHNLIQPIAQAATDVLVSALGQAAAGDNAFSQKNFADTIVSGVASAAFGITDVKDLKTGAIKVLNNIKKIGEQKPKHEGEVIPNVPVEKGEEALLKPAAQPETVAQPASPRKRGFLSETGGTEKGQLGLPPLDQTRPQSVSAHEAWKKFDEQDADVKKKFVLPLKQKILNATDAVGAALIDRAYYAKRLLGKDGDKAIGALNSVKGNSAVAKMEYDAAEKDISSRLTHDKETLLNRYLQAKRIVEIEDIKGEGTIKHTKGMTRNEADSFLKEITERHSPETVKQLESAAQKYWTEVSEKPLKELLDEGIIDKQLHDVLREQGKYYSPRRFIQHIDPDATNPIGGKVGLSESGIKKLEEGSDEAMINNWRLLLAEVKARVQTRIFKNKASKELYNYVKDNPTNEIGATVNNAVSKKIDIPTAEQMVDDFLGLKTQLESRLKNPLTVEKRLSLLKKIDDFEIKIDDLFDEKKLSEVDTDIEITEIQKKILDLKNVMRLSETDREYDFYASKLKNYTDKINKLAKMEKTKEVEYQIRQSEEAIKRINEKIANPITGTEIANIQNKISTTTKKIDNYIEMINSSKIKGKDFIELKSKKLEDVPAGFERISSMVDGKRQAIIIPTKFANSWNQTDFSMNRHVATLMNVASGGFALRPLATGALAPEFALTNIVRDAAMQWLTTKEYGVIAPVAAAKLAKSWIRVAKDAWTGKGKYGDYLKQGGGMDYLTEQGSMFKDPTQIVTPSKERNRQVYNIATKLQQFSERLGRLALRDQAIRNGKTPEEATRIASEYLDFRQGGWLTKALDNASPYLNASVQGTRSLIRSFKTDTIGTGLKALQLMVVGASTAYLANQYRKETWEDIGDREKVSRWNFPLPFDHDSSDGKKVKSYLSIPKDQSARVFATIGEVFAERQMGTINGGQAWHKISIAFGDINPVDLLGVVPPTVSAVLGMALNKDFWTRKDIWTGRNVSPHMEYYQGETPSVFIDASEQLSRLGIEVSPAKVEYAAGQVMPANFIAQFMGGTYDAVVHGIEKKEKEIINKTTYQQLSELPGARKFLRTTYPSRIDEEQLSKDIKKYGISTIDENGIQKNNKKLQSEIYSKKINESNERQKRDNTIKIIAELLGQGNKEDAIKKWNELRSEAMKSIGEKEVDRIDRRMKMILNK